MYKIFWKPKAAKQLEKITNNKIKSKIFDAVDALQDFKQDTNVKPLKNHKYDYRLRVGNYRVLFNISEIIKIISIEEVKKRDERTY